MFFLLKSSFLIKKTARACTYQYYFVSLHANYSLQKNTSYHYDKERKQLLRNHGGRCR